MEINIEKLRAIDAEELFQFELENRNFFEEMVPGRGDEFYHDAFFRERHQALLEEQAQGLADFYLIKDIHGAITGRINVIDIDRFKGKAFLGYRVGKDFIGKGIATKALKLLLEQISKEQITQISAQTTTDNIASQKVLERNEFTYIKTDVDTFEMNGKRLRFVYYLWTSTDKQAY